MRFAALLKNTAWCGPSRQSFENRAKANRYQDEHVRTQGSHGFFEIAKYICENSTHPDKDSVLIDIHFSLDTIAADSNRHTHRREQKETSFALQLKTYERTAKADERLAMAYTGLVISRTQDGCEGVTALLRQQEISKSLEDYVPQSREANLGLAYMLQGNVKEAETLMTQSIEARQKALGRDDRDSLRYSRLCG